MSERTTREQLRAMLASFTAGTALHPLAEVIRADAYGSDDAVARQVRAACDLKPAKLGRKLPRVLTADESRTFYAVVDKADDVQHALLPRLRFYTAVRVSELCGIAVADVDLEGCKIRVDQGNGAKDRYVLFGKGFATALPAHVAAHPNNR